MRPAHEAAGRSSTPIYDALCAEYSRLFRALPGDRTGEEELKFTGFRLWETHDCGRPPEDGQSRASQQGRHRGAQPALPPGSPDRQHSPYGNHGPRVRER